MLKNPYNGFIAFKVHSRGGHAVCHHILYKKLQKFLHPLASTN